MGQKPETKFRVTKVVPFLKTLKNTVYFAIQQKGIHGDADFLVCSNGRFVALELKDSGEEPRPLQRHKLNMVERAKGIALVATPENWESVQAQLLLIDSGD